MTQVFFIHGGDSFDSYDRYLTNLKNRQLDNDRLFKKARWSSNLAKDLPEFDVLYPSMPNSSNAQFSEWQIMFEKLIPFFADDVRLVGHSLGAMFLAKYLQNHPLGQKVSQLHLVAGGFNLEEYGSFELNSVDRLFESARQIYIYHSQDDFVVPFAEIEKYKHDLPAAQYFEFADRNHFLDEEFPELLQNIKDFKA